MLTLAAGRGGRAETVSSGRGARMMSEGLSCTGGSGVRTIGSFGAGAGPFSGGSSKRTLGASCFGGSCCGSSCFGGTAFDGSDFGGSCFFDDSFGG